MLALTFVACITSASSTSHAQVCERAWMPVGNLANVNGQVRALKVWDADGAGPQPAKLVAGGLFTTAGGQTVNYIAAYDFATDSWSSLGGGVNNTVYTLDVMPNGDLVAGGFFTMAGGINANYVARWNGSVWSALGTGAGGVDAPHVDALQAMPNGDLLMGGYFFSAGGVAAVRSARWDGSTWHPLLDTGDTVYTFSLFPNGNIYMGGFFVSRLWNGTQWQPYGPGGVTHDSLVLADGSLIVAGGSAQISYIYQVTESGWQTMGQSFFSSDSRTFALAQVPEGDIIAAGAFIRNGTEDTIRIARWDGEQWRQMHTGVIPDGGRVFAMTVLPNGDLIAAGDTLSIGEGQPPARFARWGIVQCPPVCNDIDFNNDGSSFDPQDIEAFLSVYSEGPCIPETATCDDIDFNNDTSVFDPCDINSFLVMYSEGPCTPCGS